MGKIVNDIHFKYAQYELTILVKNKLEKVREIHDKKILGSYGSNKKKEFYQYENKKVQSRFLI